MDTTDPAVADQQLAQARQRLTANPNDAFAASQVVKWLRKSSVPVVERHREARSIHSRFPSDPWVSFYYGWECYDLCKAYVQKSRADAATAALQAFVDAIGASASSPSGPSKSYVDSLHEKMAWQYMATVKLAKQSSSRQTGQFRQLAQIGCVLRGTALHLLSVEGQPGPDGRTMLSPHDRFLFALRRCAENAGNWALMRDLCLQVVTGELKVEKSLWFGQSLLDALRHLPDDPKAHQAADEFVRVHGDNEFVQLSLALWRVAQKDEVGATAAFRAAVAMTCKPWAWKEYALFVARQGHLEEAAPYLRAALHFVDRKNVGLTWEVHHLLSRLAMKLGAAEEAAVEAQLARLCRQTSGWPKSNDLEQYVAEHGATLGPELAKLGNADLSDLMKVRSPIYRQSWESALRDLASPYVVTSLPPGGTNAFVRPVDGHGQDAIMRLNGNGPRVAVGQRIRAITVPSWDRKRQRAGSRVVWWELG